MKDLLAVFIIIVVTAGVTYYATKSSIRTDQVPPSLRIDTFYVKADTVYKDKPLSVSLPAIIDTTETSDSLGNTITQITATADTLIRKDSSYIKVVYHYPPENFFDVQIDIKEKIITVTRNIMEYVQVPQPWYDHWYIGALGVLVLMLSVIKIL